MRTDANGYGLIRLEVVEFCKMYFQKNNNCIKVDYYQFGLNVVRYGRMRSDADRRGRMRLNLICNLIDQIHANTMMSNESIVAVAVCCIRFLYLCAK